LNNQIETAKQQFEQMVKAEEICRQAFRQNSTNQNLAILNQEFIRDMTQEPVPRPKIQYKATPLDPLPPVTAEVDKGLKEIQQQSEALKKNFARQIEKENANLTLTEQKLKTMQEKAKSPVPSTTTQYLATLQERVESLNEQLKAQSTPVCFPLVQLLGFKLWHFGICDLKHLPLLIHFCSFTFFVFLL
jgi:hypothetical protein